MTTETVPPFRSAEEWAEEFTADWKRTHDRKPRQPHRVDAVGRVPLFAPRKEQMGIIETGREGTKSPAVMIRANGSSVEGESLEVVPPDSAMIQVHFKGRSPTWGVEAIIARLAKFSITFELAPDGSLVALGPDLKYPIPPEMIDAIKTVAPLIRAHLAGEPLACAWCPAPADTLLLLGTPACALHATEAPAESEPAA